MEVILSRRQLGSLSFILNLGVNLPWNFGILLSQGIEGAGWVLALGLVMPRRQNPPHVSRRLAAKSWGPPQFPTKAAPLISQILRGPGLVWVRGPMRPRGAAQRGAPLGRASDTIAIVYDFPPLQHLSKPFSTTNQTLQSPSPSTLLFDAAPTQCDADRCAAIDAMASPVLRALAFSRARAGGWPLQLPS